MSGTAKHSSSTNPRSVASSTKLLTISRLAVISDLSFGIGSCALGRLGVKGDTGFQLATACETDGILSEVIAHTCALREAVGAVVFNQAQNQITVRHTERTHAHKKQ